MVRSCCTSRTSTFSFHCRNRRLESDGPNQYAPTVSLALFCVLFSLELEFLLQASLWSVHRRGCFHWRERGCRRRAPLNLRASLLDWNDFSRRSYPIASKENRAPFFVPTRSFHQPRFHLLRLPLSTCLSFLRSGAFCDRGRRPRKSLSFTFTFAWNLFQSLPRRRIRRMVSQNPLQRLT